jgi:hypothetical protein
MHFDGKTKNDMNLLAKIILKNTHNLKKYGILKLEKFKVILKIISKFQKPFTTYKWGIMNMMH